MNFYLWQKAVGLRIKLFLYQATPSILNKERLVPFITSKLKELGTSACPPYHLAIVVGGTSAEYNLKMVKLASARELDNLPTEGSETGNPFRDLGMEEEILNFTKDMGIGAQFGGKYFCHDVRVIRLSRHGASLPIGIGVSCAADRQAKAKITKEGLFIEQLERDPARFLPDVTEDTLSSDVVKIDLNMPMPEILNILKQHPIKTRLSLTGTIIVARDLAHARIRAIIEQGGVMPDYFKNHPIYYAGPAKTPEGYASGSFGPTTAGRMDSYVDEFQALGGSMIMLAKGNRSRRCVMRVKNMGDFILVLLADLQHVWHRIVLNPLKLSIFQNLVWRRYEKSKLWIFLPLLFIDAEGNDFFKELNL